MSEKQDFVKQLFTGTVYTAIAKYLSLIVSLVVTAILSRILLPADFAIVAIATVFIGFISLITGNGLLPAIVQNKDLTNADIENLYSFTIYIGGVAAVLFLLLSFCIADFYLESRLLGICQLLSLNILFSVFNIVPNALFFRNKEFKFVAIRTIIINTIVGTIAIFSALYGFGIYSLLINPILGSLLIYLVSFYYKPIAFKWKPQYVSLKKVLSFSTYQILFNILNYSYRNIDKLLIGRYMSMVSLGYYEKSYRLMMLPLENISSIINPVLHPMLADYQNNIRFIKGKYINIISFSAYIGFVLSAVLFFCSKEVVYILFGPQWAPSVPVFKVFALSIGIQIIQSAVGAVFQATNQVRPMCYAGLIVFVTTLFSIVVGLFLGTLVKLAFCIVLSFYLAFFIYHLALFRYVFKESIAYFFMSLWRHCIIGLIIGMGLYLFDHWFYVESNLLALLLKLLVTIIIFTILVWFRLAHFPIVLLLKKIVNDKKDNS